MKQYKWPGVKGCIHAWGPLLWWASRAAMRSSFILGASTAQRMTVTAACSAATLVLSASALPCHTQLGWHTPLHDPDLTPPPKLVGLCVCSPFLGCLRAAFRFMVQ